MPNNSLSEAEIRLLVQEVVKETVSETLTRLGLDDPNASKDIETIRGLARYWNEAASSIGKVVIKCILLLGVVAVLGNQGFERLKNFFVALG